jgi:outer membrane receptor for ferrienterochelin and colicin
MGQKRLCSGAADRLAERRGAGAGPAGLRANSQWLRIFLWLRAGTALALVGHAAAAFGQKASPVPPPAQENPDIVIVADPSQRSSIDRTAYVVRDNAEARSSNTLDLLAQVPSVEVRPDGQLRLLGRSGVTILIDGKDVPDPVTFLRNLQGSQVAKIEVISNPSAQFSARGTAGIINIVTRRSFAPGLGGSLTANVGSFGNAAVKLSPTWARGPLSLSGSLGLTRWVAPGGFERDLYLVDEDGNFLAHSSERTRYRNRNDMVSGNFLFSYKPDSKQSLGITASLQKTGGHPSRASDIVFAADPERRRRLTAQGNVANNYGDISADYRRDGARQGEQLTISGGLAVSRTKVEDEFSDVDETGGASSFLIRNENSISTATLKLDYVRPFGPKRRLSFGAKVEQVRSDILSEYAAENPTDPAVLSSRSEIDGS